MYNNQRSGSMEKILRDENFGGGGTLSTPAKVSGI